MQQNFRKGSIGAILDEYEIALADLKKTIRKISDADLIKIVDSKTRNPACKSIQTILSHVVICGYFYPTRILQHKFPDKKFDLPEIVYLNKVSEYIKALDEMFKFNVEALSKIKEREMLQADADKHIKTNWGSYDYEQIMEHAIVHIYRHRRQIRQFLLKLHQG
ncbi:MAG: DinB family protein [Bacteroidetes bacterium]|nr:DinB family protein [Bacteroidota bacterium]